MTSSSREPTRRSVVWLWWEVKQNVWHRYTLHHLMLHLERYRSTDAVQTQPGNMFPSNTNNQGRFPFPSGATVCLYRPPVNIHHSEQIDDRPNLHSSAADFVTMATTAACCGFEEKECRRMEAGEEAWSTIPRSKYPTPVMEYSLHQICIYPTEFRPLFFALKFNY